MPTWGQNHAGQAARFCRRRWWHRASDLGLAGDGNRPHNWRQEAGSLDANPAVALQPGNCFTLSSAWHPDFERKRIG